jgi:hypothetical protein
VVKLLRPLSTGIVTVVGQGIKGGKRRSVVDKEEEQEEGESDEEEEGEEEEIEEGTPGASSSDVSSTSSIEARNWSQLAHSIDEGEGEGTEDDGEDDLGDESIDVNEQGGSTGIAPPTGTSYLTHRLATEEGTKRQLHHPVNTPEARPTPSVVISR